MDELEALPARQTNHWTREQADALWKYRNKEWAGVLSYFLRVHGKGEGAVRHKLQALRIERGEQ